ncbi:MAG TPA: glycoside hydrolase [Verrucomicrobiota bacterium]|nr:glycoside hydrolase [Verrucomicrobiota bacterium]
MNLQRILAAGMTALAALATFSSFCAECVIDARKTQGTWDAWGTSLCWFANVFGDRDDVADVLFTLNTVTLEGQALPGLGLNMVRYNAGACSTNEVDGQRIALSRAIPAWKQIRGFWLDGKSEDPNSPSWDWSVDARQRAMLLKARDRGVNWFELFSNSPMWWMCANRNPSGAARATDDNLPPENYEKFAVYLATIAKYAKENWGVTFTSVEPFNEPCSDYWHARNGQEGCHFSPATQAKVLRFLRAELDERGLQDMPIAASDESKYDWAVETWKSFDEAAKALVNQVNVHGYQQEQGQREELFRITRGKRLWNSEYGDGDASGLSLTRNLHLDFRQLRPTGWAYRQPLDGGARGGWGLLPANLSRGTIGRANPKYFVLAQYTRHIRQGMIILTTDEDETVAAHDLKRKRLVIVAHNLTDQPIEKTWALSHFEVPDGAVACWRTEPRGSARYEKVDGLEVKNGRIVLTLAPHSVQTMEVENVTASGSDA